MHGTTRHLVQSGDVTPSRRATVDDLEFAIEWLEAYEGDPEDDDGTNLTSAATVAEYLRREVAKRNARRNAGW